MKVTATFALASALAFTTEASEFKVQTDVAVFLVQISELKFAVFLRVKRLL